MKRAMLMAVAIGALLMFSGCATTSHITKLPKPAEFKKELSTLNMEYPDLTKYSSSGRDWFVTIFEMPGAGPLTEAWNKPSHTRLSAWMLFPVIPWIFQPTTVWTWEYENKIITARIDHPLAFGYRPHVWKLNVEENK